jgi:sRNA-binding protein
MPFRKTEEEKQAEAAQQAAEAAAQAARQQAAAEEKRRAEHAASPVGRAEAARERGDAFIQIEIAGVEVDGASSFGSSNSTMKRIEGTTKVLGESRLSVGASSMPAGSSSRPARRPPTGSCRPGRARRPRARSSGSTYSGLRATNSDT